MTIYKLPKADQRDFDKEYWELTDAQLDKLIKSELEEDRELAAHFGRDKNLDILVRDKSPLVRACVTREGRNKDLDILARDANEDVRWWVAA